MMMSLRKSFSDTSAPRPEPKFQTLLAHCSNSVSWVTPRSSVMASYFGAARRFAAGAGVAALAMLDDLGGALERADLADAGDVPAVPLDAELEVLVRVETLCVDGELCHRLAPPFGAADAPIRPNLASHLLDLDDDELGRLERRKADHDVDDAAVDVVLRRRLPVALDEVGLPRRPALEGALAEQVVHEGADVQADLRPQRLVVRLEDHPLRAAIQAFLDEEREPADRDVLPLRGQAVVAAQVRLPQTTRPAAGNARRQLTPSGFSSPFSRSVSLTLSSRHAVQCGVEAGRRLPDAALGVGPRR